MSTAIVSVSPEHHLVCHLSTYINWNIQFYITKIISNNSLHINKTYKFIVLVYYSLICFGVAGITHF